MKISTSALIVMLLSSPVHADDYVHIPDMSQLSWQMDVTGRVYLRNLSQFNSQFMGCCYNHYIETVTATEKQRWATVLTYIASGRPMTLYVQNKAQPGPVTFIMN